MAAFGIQLSPEANALEVGKAVSAKMNDILPSFPAGVSWFWAFDSTTFIKVAIRESPSRSSRRWRWCSS